MQSLKALEESYKTALGDLTTRERSRMVQYGRQILTPVFSQLQTLAGRYREQQAKLDGFIKRATDLETEISSVQVTPPEPEKVG